MLQLGLRLHDAEQLPIEDLLPVVKEKGYSCVHLALSKAMKEYPCTPVSYTHLSGELRERQSGGRLGL